MKCDDEGNNALISSFMLSAPLPPCVMKKAISFPEKSVCLMKVLTGAGREFHQLGHPMNRQS